MKLSHYALAGIAGVSMAVQGAVNAILGKKVGGLPAAFIVHALGMVVLALILTIQGSWSRLSSVRGTSFYAFLGGPLSVLIIWAVLSSVQELGVAAATTVIVATQIMSAFVLDAFGVTGMRTPLSWHKVLGAAAIAGGTYLLLGKMR